MGRSSDESEGSRDCMAGLDVPILVHMSSQHPFSPKDLFSGALSL